MQFSMKQFPFFTACTVFLTLAPQLAAPESQTPSVSKKTAPFAEKIQINGVNNAGKINDHLFRGAQPHGDGVQSLHQLGVTTIIDLRGEHRDQSESERQLAEGLGMKFLVIPEDGWSNPTDAQIAQFFNTIAERPQQTVFIHCRYGEDRTGVFVATYRIAFAHWSPQQAIAEMHNFHFNSLWHPNMENYVKHFPQRLASAEKLAGFRSIPESSPIEAHSLHP